MPPSSDNSAPPSSPVCAADAGSDAYMNRVEPAELVAFLNQLLEAERAGTRVARESREQCTTAPERQLMADIHGDEARWCKMLMDAIPRLDGEPSLRVGDFYQRAMAISGLDERLRFLNRGQGCGQAPRTLAARRHVRAPAPLARKSPPAPPGGSGRSLGGRHRGLAGGRPLSG
ncbi:MAG: hypothetical protein IPH23_14865 [Gammaproteobacteria bacterium]|nr:hypothetical protein [Gammaproteobacteria bacterium]